jgi:hypothetical protein
MILRHSFVAHTDVDCYTPQSVNKVAPRNKIPGIAECNRQPIPEVDLIPGNFFGGLA